MGRFSSSITTSLYKFRCGIPLDNVGVVTAWMPSEVQRSFGHCWRGRARGRRAWFATSWPESRGCRGRATRHYSGSACLGPGRQYPGLPAALKPPGRPGPADARGPTQTGGDLLGMSRQPGPRRRLSLAESVPPPAGPASCPQPLWPSDDSEWPRVARSGAGHSGRPPPRRSAAVLTT
jgi:hypothetical protein